MRWSWTVARIKGIDVDIHATFLLLLAWIALADYQQAHTVSAAVVGVLLTLAIFLSVVLHEFGHALMAARFGVKTKSITLLPIGGVARLERMPSRPREELLIALAGPVVTVAIIAVLYLALLLGKVSLASAAQTHGIWLFLAQVMWVNVILAIFNLLPAFPMDGGRILRAILAFRMSRARATLVAARVGRGFAIAMGIAGLLWNPMLAVIAVFVWLAAGQEAAMEQLKTTLRGVSVADAMVSGFDTMPADESLAAAASRIAQGFQHDFPVVDHGHIVGMLSRSDVRRGLAAASPDTPIAEVMHRRFPTADAGEELDAVLGRLPPDGSAVLVTAHDHPVGLLDPRHIEELLAMRQAHPRGAV